MAAGFSSAEKKRDRVIRLSAPSESNDIGDTVPGGTTSGTVSRRDGTFALGTAGTLQQTFLSTRDFAEIDVEKDPASKYLIKLPPEELIKFLGEQVAARKGASDPFDAVRSSCSRRGSARGSGMTQDARATSGLRTSDGASSGPAAQIAQPSFEAAPMLKREKPAVLRRQALVRTKQ